MPVLHVGAGNLYGGVETLGVRSRRGARFLSTSRSLYIRCRPSWGLSELAPIGGKADRPHVRRGEYGPAEANVTVSFYPSARGYW